MQALIFLGGFQQVAVETVVSFNPKLVELNLADATARYGAAAHERGEVLAIGSQPKIGEDVAHLFSLEQPATAAHDVRDATAHKLAFEIAHLHAAAHEQGIVFVQDRVSLTPGVVLNLLSDDLGAVL